MEAVRGSLDEEYTYLVSRYFHAPKMGVPVQFGDIPGRGVGVPKGGAKISQIFVKKVVKYDVELDPHAPCCSLHFYVKNSQVQQPHRNE